MSQNSNASMERHDGVPLLSLEGDTYSCGLELGEKWRPVLKEREISICGRGELPWWCQTSGPVSKLVDTIAPHLRELMLGIAKGAGLENSSWNDAGSSAPEGCTSFSVAPENTIDGCPISGQSKDTHRRNASRYLVLRLKPVDAPAFLTVTYPGELFGYGFCSTGMALFRNSLYVAPSKSGLPFHLWGLLALCLQDVEHVREMSLEFGVLGAGNALLADKAGNSLSFEMSSSGIGIVKQQNGVNVHANHILNKDNGVRENISDELLACSRHRQKRLTELLLSRRGKINIETVSSFLTDHENYPASVCNHLWGEDFETTASIVAVPSKGLLSVTRGLPCQNTPTRYSLSNTLA